MMLKRLISLFLVVVLCFSMLSILSACSGGDEEHTCLKCNGSGRVRDEYGYYAYVSCPRCGGSGSLTY